MTTYTINRKIRTLFTTLAIVTADNPVLLEGEIWTEKSAMTGQGTGRRKIGDGTTAFNSLPFEPVATDSDAVAMALIFG